MAVRFIDDNEMDVYSGEGLTLGYGVFETIAIRSGKAVALERHLTRLKEACETIGVEAPDSEVMRSRLDVWLVENGLTETDAFKIIALKRGDDTCILIVKRSNPYRTDDGRILSICKAAGIRDSASLSVGIKSTSYMNNLLEKQRANRLGFDECYFLNQKGFLSEGSYTNIFIMSDGIIMTPHESCGLLKGISRGLVIDGARTAGVQIEQCKDISMDVLKSSAGIVLTNALMGVRAVGCCDGIEMKESYRLETILKEIMENNQ